MTERQIQDGLCAYLRKNKLSFVRNRMDKKSCIREGWPDITVIHCGRAWLCETKTSKGRLSAKQKEVIAELQANGTPVRVATSLEVAIGSLNAWMGVERAGDPIASAAEPSVTDRDIASAMGATLEAPQPGAPLFIGNICGKDYVLSGDPKPGGYAALVRTATAADLINIRRR